MLCILLHVGLLAVSSTSNPAGGMHWREIQSCGPNALYVMLRMDGHQPDYDLLVQKMNVTEKGVSIADLVKTAAAFGLPLKAVRADVDSLPVLPVPAIIHFQRPGGEGHFLLLLKVHDDGSFTTFEATRGNLQRISQGDFYQQWSGMALVRSSDWNVVVWNQVLFKTSVVLLIGAALFIAFGSRRLRWVRRQPDGQEKKYWLPLPGLSVNIGRFVRRLVFSKGVF